jgi:molecular chaperone GrpE
MATSETTDTLNKAAAADAAKDAPATPSAKAPESKSEPTPPSAEGKPDLAAQLAAAKQEAATNHDRYLRTVADLENFRRRTVREKDELRQFAASRVLEDLLPALDNLGLGLAATKQPNADLKTLASGVEMVLTQLKTTLANHGLKEINPVGQPFDANLHESISAQPSDTLPEGSVVTVVRIGYSLNGRLLRPASVVVSSGPAKKGESQA